MRKFSFPNVSEYVCIDSTHLKQTLFDILDRNGLPSDRELTQDQKQHILESSQDR